MAAGASSASGGGLAGGDAAGQAQQQQQQGSSGELSAYAQQWADSVTSQLSSLSEANETMREFLMSHPWHGQPGGEDGDEFGPGNEYGDEYGAEGFDGEYGLNPEVGGLDAEALAQLEPGTYDLHDDGTVSLNPEALIGQQVAEQLAPVHEQQRQTAERVNQLALERAADDLASEFEELRDPATAEEVMSVTSQYAAKLGISMASPQSFALARLVFMAGKAVQHAIDEEGVERTDAATLEGGSGSAPAGGRPMDGDGFLKALQKGSSPGSSVLPFLWTPTEWDDRYHEQRL